MSGLQFDNKISLGHIISIGLIIFGGITAYADLRGMQNQLAAEVANMSRAAENREARARSLVMRQTARQFYMTETVTVGQSVTLNLAALRAAMGVAI